MFKFVILFSCVALALGAVRREAPSGSAHANLLAEFQAHAEAFEKTFTEQLNAVLNSKNAEEVKNTLKKSTDDVLQHMSTLSNSLQGVLSDANGKTKEALEQTRQNIEKAVAELRKAHPEVEQQATQLKEKLQTAVQSTATEAKKLVKEMTDNIEATNEKLAPQVKAAFEEFGKQAEAVQKKIHEVATKQ